MHIDYAVITHRGRIRKNNEDAYLVSAMDGSEPHTHLWDCPEPKVGSLAFLAAVADGMGGAAAGEIASREGLAALDVSLFVHWARFPDAATEDTLFKSLEQSAKEASDAVIRYSEEDQLIRGMGSTLTASVFWQGHAYLCQVGDSRAYLYRCHHLTQLTQDQTLVNDLVARGALRPEDARRHPQRSMITQALGCPVPIEPALGKLALRQGDRLLLCSDGLHGELSQESLMQWLSPQNTPVIALEGLLQAALDGGGRDNITGVILDINDGTLPSPQPHEAIPILATPPKGDGMMTRISRFFTGKP